MIELLLKMIDNLKGPCKWNGLQWKDEKRIKEP